MLCGGSGVSDSPKKGLVDYFELRRQGVDAEPVSPSSSNPRLFSRLIDECTRERLRPKSSGEWGHDGCSIGLQGRQWTAVDVQVASRVM